MIYLYDIFKMLKMLYFDTFSVLIGIQSWRCVKIPFEDSWRTKQRRHVIPGRLLLRRLSLPLRRSVSVASTQRRTHRIGNLNRYHLIWFGNPTVSLCHSWVWFSILQPPLASISTLIWPIAIGREFGLHAALNASLSS